MSGIIGILYKKGTCIPLQDSHLTSLIHRGPDNQGVYTDSYVSLGQTELHTTNPTQKVKLPLLSHDHRYCIVYDGNIYNRVELKATLIGLGAKFTTNSDLEIILEAYRIWQENCVDYLHGAFSFAIWDKDTKKLFTCKDKCGERPFYYYHDDNIFIFASELKALVPLLPKQPTLNRKVINLYFYHNCAPEPLTFLTDVCKLPKAHKAEISIDTWKYLPCCYWDMQTIAKKENALIQNLKNEAEAAELVLFSFENAVKKMLPTDVPVGLGLSGGIDSSAIAALAVKHATTPIQVISIGYPGRPPYDERKQAKELATTLGLPFQEVEITPETFVDFLPQLVDIIDEPIADIASFSHYTIPKILQEHGIKVLLTGIGGDEFFWGYKWLGRSVETTQKQWESIPAFMQIMPKVLQQAYLNSQRSKSKKIHFSLLSYIEENNDFLLRLYSKTMQKEVGSENIFAPLNIGQCRYDDTKVALIDLICSSYLANNALSLGDRVSMACGVEARLPFLDSDLIETIIQLTHTHQNFAYKDKALLRNALRPVLSQEILSRSKAGFQPPTELWMQGLNDLYIDLLINGELVTQDIIEQKEVQIIIQEKQHIYQKKQIIYKLILLEIWFRNIKKIYNNKPPSTTN